MARNEEDDIKDIVKKVKHYRPKGKGPATKKELDDLCLAIDEAMQPIWQEEKKLAALSEIEASKIIINT